MPRTGVMLAKPFDERPIGKWPKPFFVQPKIDGHRARLEWDFSKGQTPRLISSQGNEIHGVPHILDELKDLGMRTSLKLDGELYIHGEHQQTVTGIVNTKIGVRSGYTKVKYIVFDACEPDIRQEVRIRLINALFDGTPTSYVKPITTYKVNDLEEAHGCLGFFIHQGYEGIIFRNPEALYEPKRTSNLLKYKPMLEDVYQIIGTEEEISVAGSPKNRLGAFVCTGPDVFDPFRVGTGPLLDADGRRRLWDTRNTLPGRYLCIRYQNLTINNKPRFPVAIAIVNP